MIKHFKSIVCLSTFLLGNAAADTGSTSWTTSFTVNPPGLNSRGLALGSDFVLGVGWFNLNFIPDVSNIRDWNDNWHAVSSATQQSYESNSYYGYDGGTTDSQTGAPEIGKQVYFFGYNGELFGSGNFEAFLFRQNNTVFPGSGSLTLDLADGPEGSDDDVTVIWGRVDRNLAFLTGVLEGDGKYKAPTPVDTNGGYEGATWEFQAASDATE